MLKWDYTGTYSSHSPPTFIGYADKFSARHNVRPLDTLDQMAAIVRRATGKRLTCPELTS